MRRSGRGAVRAAGLRRLLFSVPGLSAVLLAFTLTTGTGLAVLSSWSEQRAVAQAQDNATVVFDLSLRSRLLSETMSGVRTPNAVERFDIQADVNVLRRDRRIVGLEVWRLDGTALFVDAGHPDPDSRLPAQQLTRAAEGRPWVDRSSRSGRREATVDVLLPYEDVQGDLAALVKVLLPEQHLEREIRTAQRWLAVAFVVLVATATSVLLVVRRRLGRRESLARHDALTGLVNRTALFDDARAVLAAEVRGRHAALLVIDLDGFKAVNDTLGHTAGDALLVRFAATLRRAVRPGDVVARLGGDEFAILVADLPVEQDPAQVARGVLAQLRAASFTVHGVELAVDASIGVAVQPQDGQTVQELLQHADVAMYQAKRAHTGLQSYDPATDHHDVGQLAVLVELREALRRDELVLHYQPQVELPTGRVVAVEALVRWQHPTRGLLGPDTLIPLAETTGLMHPLTDWVLRTAVRQAADWRRTGAPLRIAVNISPRSLLEGDLPATVLHLLAAEGLPAALLELEITETAVMGDPDGAARVLRQLDALGVKVSIDDFGAGYTSLAHLKDLPVKALKIDRALVTGLLERSEDEAVTSAVIDLGHRLGLSVLAEGVETPAVYDRLGELGCDEVQGYVLSRPLPAAALEGWLTGWRDAHPHPLSASRVRSATR